MDDTNEPKFIILAPEEPDLDKMQKKIMDMLDTGKSVNDIAISLHMDPDVIQGFADKFSKQRWQDMKPNDMRKEHILMLNEIAELGKLQYMSDPKPPHAFAVASIIKTVNEIFRDVETSDNMGLMQERIEENALRPVLEQLVISMTKEIGQTRKALAESLPPEKRPEAVRMVDDIAKALAVHTKSAFEDFLGKMEVVFNENASKQKVGSKKPTGNGIVNLVPNVDPR